MNRIKYTELLAIGGSIEKLFLKPIDVSDTDNIIRWRNQDFVKNNFIDRRDFTWSSHMEWIKDMVEHGNAIQYIIEHGDEHNPVGTVYIRDIDLINASGELGIFIGESDYMDKGIGTKTIEMFLPYCFSLGFHRIFLRVISENDRAIRCYLKSGFSIEGKAREMIFCDQKWQDVIFMSRLYND